MKRKGFYITIASLVFCLSLIRLFSSYFAISYKDFDLLAGKGTRFYEKLSKEDKKELSFFKNRYLKSYELIKNKDSVGSIPKVIHYIWVGPKPFPKSSISFVKGMIDKHKDWKINFWCDDSQKLLPHPVMIRRDVSELSDDPSYVYLSKTDNFGEKSDVLRYIILQKEGGVYVDHDIECFRSFNELASTFNFFTGLEPPHQNEGLESKVFPCNAIIGVRPLHPVMKRTLDYLNERWDDVENAFTGCDSRSLTLKVLHRTFHSFTLAVKENAALKNPRDIILPASFFYSDPIINSKKSLRWKKKGLVIASHKCQGQWRPEAELVATQERVDALKKQKIYYQKKYSLAKNLLYGNLIVSITSIFLLVRQKRKIRKNAI